MLFEIPRSRLFFRDETPRPLGRLALAGELRGSNGVDPKKPRVLGRYALILLARGAGLYRDARGRKTPVVAGQAILVFPELAHAYGPSARGDWDEIYVCFDGPIFDLWRAEGLLDSERPVFEPASPRCFGELRNVLESPRPLSVAAHLEQLQRFLALLSQMLPLDDAPGARMSWLERAQAVLGSNLEKPDVLRDAANAAGQSYETFRKNFAREAGVSPSRFRDARRLEAAKTLLLRGEMTNAAIARSLGFRDEAHFSRRFKQLTTQTPRDFRRAAQEKEIRHDH